MPTPELDNPFNPRGTPDYWVAASGGETLELAFADFKAGTYRVAGVTAPRADIVVANPDWDPTWNPATHIDAGGLTGAPAIADALGATLLADGFTVVGTLNPHGSVNGQFRVETVDLPDFSQEIWVGIGWGNSDVKVEASPDDFVVGGAPIPLNTLSVFAATLVGNKVSVSVNGANVMTTSTAAPLVSNTLVLGDLVSLWRLETLMFQPAQADADLPTLSAP